MLNMCVQKGLFAAVIGYDNESATLTASWYWRYINIWNYKYSDSMANSSANNQMHAVHSFIGKQ